MGPSRVTWSEESDRLEIRHVLAEPSAHSEEATDILPQAKRRRFQDPAHLLGLGLIWIHRYYVS
jgi:hypothetical protein